MSRNTEQSIGSQHFSGVSNVYSKETGGLAAVARTLLQDLARVRTRDLNILDLVDNSGGAAGIAVTVDATGGAFEDMWTVTAHGLTTGDGPFQVGGTTPPTGTAVNTDYWVIVKNANVFQLASSKANAVGGTPVELASDGSSVLILAPRGQVATTALTDANLTGLTTGITSASLNTAADTVMTAIATLIERVNLVRVPLGLGTLDDGPGTGGAGTIAVIDDSAANNSGNTDSATYASGTKALGDLLDAERTAIVAVNEIRVAVGLDAITVFGPHGGSVETGLDINQGAAIENASDGADATSTFLLTEWDATLDNMADNIALLADLVDEVTDNTGTVQFMLPFTFNVTNFSAGTNLTVQAPLNGHIVGLHAVVTNATVATGNNVITVTANGATVVGLGTTVSSTDVVGTTYDDAIAEIATGVVKQGDSIVIETDGGSTAAGLDGWLIFQADGSNNKNLAAFAAS
jgi:hypothetical protein